MGSAHWPNAGVDCCVPVLENGASPRSCLDRAWALLALFVLLFGTELARVPSQGWDTFYAEDGRTFVGDWVSTSKLTMLFQPYAGYQHLLPRVITWLVVHLMPITWWANGVIAFSALTVSGVACLVFVASRDVLTTTVARLGAAAVPVFLPLARFEAIGNVANLHSYMLYLIPWLFLARSRSQAAAVGFAAAAAVAVMTEPQCVIFLPLAVIVWFWRRDSRWVVVGWALGAAGQTITYLHYAGIRPSSLDNFRSWVEGYAVNAVATDAVPSGARLGSLVARFGWWPAMSAAVVFFGIAIFAGLIGSRWLRVLVLTVSLASVASWSASFFLNDHRAFDYDALSPGQLASIPFVGGGSAPVC